MCFGSRVLKWAVDKPFARVEVLLFFLPALFCAVSLFGVGMCGWSSFGVDSFSVGLGCRGLVLQGSRAHMFGADKLGVADSVEVSGIRKPGTAGCCCC